MSRLIDLDKALAEAEDECRMSDDWKVSHEMMNVFKYQPIIKAIPKEWIKNYARRKASKGFTEIDCYWQYWEEDVLKMVADWEKENGRD